jgi:DNA-directed RNA polymerase I subunit RPA1
MCVTCRYFSLFVTTFFAVNDDTTSDELAHLLQEHIKKSPEDEVRLDSAMKQVSNGLTSAIVKAALPRGLLKPFPRNNFYLMVSSGAKGTDVNFSMIGCCLGQMELEGRRVARTVSGRTLPSFRPFQVDVVSGGFIGQRFLTGIKPQEYYFHCAVTHFCCFCACLLTLSTSPVLLPISGMAGREGLVDTAVKTSRSGYLQRCIIKHLETLVVRHDGTVRDSDDSIVQFQYGEDGLDPAHYRSVTNMKLLRENVAILERRLKSANAKLPKQLRDDVRRYHRTAAAQRDRTVLRFHFPTEFGVVSDTYLAQLEQEEFPSAAERNQFQRLMLINFLRGLAPAGEAVGVLAGQSIGEPSTQMTLNTFHLAGHGNVNVTLGVPRLRELLMVGGTPKLPTMAVPFRASASAEGIEAAKAAWANASLATIFSESVIRKELPVGELHFSDTIYLRLRGGISALGLTWKSIVQVVQREFVPRLIRQIRLDLRRKAAYHSMQVDNSAPEGREGASAGGDEDGDAAAHDSDDDKAGDAAGSDGDEADDDGNGRKSSSRGRGAGAKAVPERGAVEAAPDGFIEHDVPSLCAHNKQGVFVDSIWSLNTQDEKVVRIVIRSQASGEQILMSSILEATLKKQLVRELPGINRAVFSTLDKGPGSPLVMLTEGANVLLLAPWVHLLDVAQLKVGTACHSRISLLLTKAVQRHSAHTALVRCGGRSGSAHRRDCCGVQSEPRLLCPPAPLF